MISPEQQNEPLKPTAQGSIFDAVVSGDLAAVHALLIADPNQANAEDDHGWPILRWAAKLGKLPIVRLLLEYGADARPTKNPSSTSPLVTATVHGHTDVVALFLEQGVDIHARYGHGDTLLHIAAYWGTPSLVRTLLARGADPRLKDGKGLTPLMHATKADNREVARILVDVGSPLDLFSAVVLGLEDAVNGILTANPAIVGERMNDHLRWSPLHYAAATAQPAMVRLLLSRNADVDCTDKHGSIPLHRAAARGHVEVVQVLLTAGANPNAKADNGRTPLHWSARDGQVEVVKCLLANGADAAVEDDEGNTALDEAIEEDHDEVIELLLPYDSAN